MKYITLMLVGCLVGCGGSGTDAGDNNGTPVPVTPPIISPYPADYGVVRARATVVIDQEKGPQGVLLQSVTASDVVTYANVSSATMTINTTNFVAGSFTGTTLSLGHVDLATLSDNTLNVCGAGGTTQCTLAVIRVYTTGSTSGFVNTSFSPNYGVPVYAGSLQPTQAIGLNSAGSVQVQTVAIAASKHKLTIADFPSPNYSVTSDFSNAGSGSYSMTFVVEYVLQ